MTEVQKPKRISFEQCIEQCYLDSKMCYEKADGTPICPFDYQKCADVCRKRYFS